MTESISYLGGLEAFDGQGPLHLSSQWGQEKVVTCLIEHGADINKQDAEGNKQGTLGNKRFD